MLHDDSSLGTNLESLWQTEIAQRDSFLLLWSPDALDRPRVIAEFRHAKQIQKPRMAVLFPFKYETDIGGNAHRYVDPPPGWDPNEKWERLVGLQFTKQAQIFAPPTRGSVQLRRGGEEMVDRLAAWIKAASAGKSLTSV